MTGAEVIRQLSLEPLEGEGGYFRRIFVEEAMVETGALGNFTEERLPLTSVIYYLMTEQSFSALHYLAGNEVWTWIAGDLVTQVVVDADRSVRQYTLGFAEGAQPVSVVPGGSWQASRLARPIRHGYALCSTVMSPAFDAQDFILADRLFLRGFDSPAAALLEPFLASQAEGASR